MDTRDTNKNGSRLGPWILVALWLALVWGHSLMSGPESSAESSLVVEWARWILQFLHLDALPPVARLMGNYDLFHHVVRKCAHFTEYFILGLLVVRALLRTVSNRLLAAAILVAFWVGVPLIDEFIQRFTPQRSGQMSDSLLDMSGFASALALCGIVALVMVQRGRTSRSTTK